MRKYSLAEWLRGELNLRNGDFDIILNIKNCRYRVREFTPTWWILNVASALALVAIALMIQLIPMLLWQK